MRSLEEQVLGAEGIEGIVLRYGAFHGPRVGTTEAGEVQGSFTAPDPGNACGWQDLADVLGAMATGDVHVNVHSTQFPGGEIRGQVTVD
jgi:hypothetical protein